MISVVIGNQKRLTQNCLTITVRYLRVQIGSKNPLLAGRDRFASNWRNTWLDYLSRRRSPDQLRGRPSLTFIHCHPRQNEPNHYWEIVCWEFFTCRIVIE
jgi:hypothetical protein